MEQRYNKALLRFAGAVMILMTFCYLFGHIYIRIMLPFISYGIEYGGSKYEVLEAKVMNRDNIEQIHYTIRTHEPFIDQEGKTWPASDQTVGIHAYVIHICPIIVFSLLWSYPYLTGKRKLLAALVSIPLVFLAATIDVSVNLLYSLKQSYNFATLPGQVTIHWYHDFANLFLNTGGRQFLALLVFILSVAPFHMNTEISRSSSGSGKPELKRRCPVSV